jgi:protein SCO1/2
VTLDAATPPRLPGTRVLVIMGAIVTALFLAVLLPLVVFRDDDRGLKDLGTVPAFSLVDERGQTFTDEALRGHPTIINFIFTRCDTVCPITSMKMQRLEDRSRDKRGIAVKFLSFTVDPEHDTPAALAKFAERYKANPERWRFVTGKAAEIRALVEGPFMSPMDRDGTTTSGSPNIVHGGYFLLVDGQLKIRGVYDSNDIHRLDDLLHDARYLARTQRRGYKFGGE